MIKKPTNEPIGIPIRYCCTKMMRIKPTVANARNNGRMNEKYDHVDGLKEAPV